MCGNYTKLQENHSQNTVLISSVGVTGCATMIIITSHLAKKATSAASYKQ